MKRNRVIVGIAVFAIVLAACSPSAPAATPTTAPVSIPTQAPAATSAAAVPTVPVATISIDDPNAVKTASGLKYVDIVPGTGATPTSTDWVTVQFTATLQDGKIIGATRPRGAPAQIPLDQLAKEVPGWAEGMSTMKVGGTRKLIIPPNLAYGDKGAGNGIIPPNATLIFMVDMLDTRPAPQVKIEDTKVGTGAEAKTGSTISVMYTGTLTNGQVFDSSYQRNEPFTVTLGAGQVIPGWEQGLQGMKVGGERTLTIPPELGYGAQGAGNAIPPNATLIFQVQLLDVK